MCCSSDAPDYSGIAAANAQAAERAYQAASEDLAFRKQVYEDSKPKQEALTDLIKRTTDQQLQSAEKSQQRADSQWDDYVNVFRPVEKKMVDEAMDYGGVADQERAAGAAVADVRQQTGLQRESTNRSLTSMGINPNSGKFVGLNRMADATDAAAVAGASNTARVAARDKGISLRAGAASFGRNMPNTSGQLVGLSTQSGNSAVGNANTGFTSGLPYASFVAGGTGNQIAAANLQQQGALGLGGLMSNDYRSANSGSGLEGLGALAGGAAKLYAAISSKELKTNKKPISESVALMGLERLPVEQWDYKPGVADGGTHVGPYAEDMQKEFGDDVAPGGKAIDLISVSGLHHLAIKKLAKDVRGLKRLVKNNGSGRVIDGEATPVDDESDDIDTGGKGGPAVLPHVGLTRIGA